MGNDRMEGASAPTFAEALRVWLKIGDLYAKKGAKQDAIETYLKVARFYHDQGFFLKAVAVYKQILKLDPRLVDVILKLAELYRQLGLMSDAMQHFDQSLEVAPVRRQDRSVQVQLECRTPRRS